MNNKKKNGFTLAELTIVLVLLAVLSVSIIGFVSVIHAHIKNYSLLQDVVDDLTFCKKTAVAWFSYFDDEDYELVVNNDQMIARHKQTGSGYMLSFGLMTPDKDVKKGVMVAQYDDGRTGTYETTMIRSVSFSSGADGKFVRCVIIYDSVGAGSSANAIAERFDFVIARKTAVK